MCRGEEAISLRAGAVALAEPRPLVHSEPWRRRGESTIAWPAGSAAGEPAVCNRPAIAEGAGIAPLLATPGSASAAASQGEDRSVRYCTNREHSIHLPARARVTLRRSG